MPYIPICISKKKHVVCVGKEEISGFHWRNSGKRLPGKRQEIFGIITTFHIFTGIRFDQIHSFNQIEQIYV